MWAPLPGARSRVLRARNRRLHEFSTNNHSNRAGGPAEYESSRAGLTLIQLTVAASVPDKHYDRRRRGGYLMYPGSRLGDAVGAAGYKIRSRVGRGEAFVAEFGTARLLHRNPCCLGRPRDVVCRRTPLEQGGPPPCDEA
jgi:hypothetical protein